MSLLYHTGIYLYSFLLTLLAALGHKKARLWIKGRKGWKQRLTTTFQDIPSSIWFHCASLGEYELSVPLIEALKKDFPEKVIVVTFFSPSGYEIKKQDPLVFHVAYLPVDSASNATFFIDTIKPEAVFFAKYDYWYHFLRVLKARSIPTYVFSATFRASQVFFKSYGTWYKNMLHCFTTLFVTNENSKQLLQQAGITNVIVTGDNRYDRVFSTAKQNRAFPLIERFAAGRALLIAGSTWPEDEKVLQTVIASTLSSLKYVIAPHEIGADHLAQLEAGLSVPSLRYSQLNDQTSFDNVMVIIIDNIGMLSSLYKYGSISYVGGAFKQGLHNILEPLSFGLPVIFGPDYKKYPEADDFIKAGGAFSIHDAATLKQTILSLLNPSSLENIKQYTRTEIEKHVGATDKIMNHLPWKK